MMFELLGRALAEEAAEAAETVTEQAAEAEQKVRIVTLKT